MAANKETRILKSNTLEQFRQKSNEISLHLGDNEQLGGQFTDKVYDFVDVSAGSLRFFGNDDNSKTIRFEIKPEESLDNTAGYLILNDVSSLTGFAAGATISQSGGFSGTVVSSTTEKILLTNTSGTYNTDQDITDNSANTIAAANHDRVHSEGFSVGVVRVYKNNTEINQGMGANEFHVASLAARLPLTGSPDVSEITEGSIINQTGGFSGTVLYASSSQVLFKAVTGTFQTNQVLTIRNHPDDNINNTTVLTAAQTGAIVSYDTAYGNAIELNTPAAANDDIKIFSANLVDALNELQGDIGSVESLTTTATTLQGAINEHDAELGTITAGAMGTTASTVSGAIAEHESQIGNININSIASGNNSITGALVQLHGEVGDLSLNTSATDLTAAVNEIEAVFDASAKRIVSTPDFTLDVEGDIILDANGQDIQFKDGGTHFGSIRKNNNDLQLLSNLADGDLVFRGLKSGPAGVTALTLDMSNDGRATFNDSIIAVGTSSFVNLDISGNVDVDGSLETDALSINGTTVSSTAAELNILDGATLDVNELNILDGATLSTAELNLLDGVTATTNELNILDGVTASAADINLIDGITNGTVIASKAIITDSNKDISGGRNITISGEMQSGSLDINGVADISGNLTIGTLATSSQHVKGAIAEHETDIGNMTLTGVTATDLSGAVRELASEAGAIAFVSGGPADAANPTNLTSAINAIDAEIGNTSYTGSDVTGAIATAQTNIGTIGSLATSAGNLVAAVNELHTEVNANASNISSNDTDIATINTNIGSLGSLTTSVTSSIVNAINSVEDEVDALQTFQTTTNTNIGTIGNLGTSATSLVTAINELHGEINSNDTDIGNLQTGKLSLSSGSSQTINSNISFTGSGKTMTFASGTTLDLSAATLTLGGGGSTLNFNTAFIELDVDANQQGLKIKRESITGVSNGAADAQLRWNEGISDQALGWEVVYPNAADDGGNITSSLVTFENARNLISGTETGISVAFDDTNNRYDFSVSVDDSTIEISSGNLQLKNNGITASKLASSAVTTGKIASSAVTNAKIANATIANNKLANPGVTVTDGTNSTVLDLGETLTIQGTSDEIEVVENANTFTVGLPNNVTIAGDLTVQGTTTTINTAELSIEDKTIQIGNNANTLADTNGAGIEFGNNAGKPTLLWDNANTRLTVNKEFHSSVGFNGVGTNLTALNASNISSGTISDDRLPATITSNITGNVTGDLTGNADTATTLATARNFEISGDITANAVSFNGSGAVNLVASIDENTVDVAELNVSGSPSVGKAITYSSGGGLEWSTISFTDTNTTYDISAVDSGDNAIIRLTAGGSGSGTDDITLEAGSNITLTPSGDTITIASTQATVNDSQITIGAGALIDVSADNNFTLNQSGAQTINVDVDLTELTLETADVAGTDHLVYIDNGTQKKIAFSNVNLSAFDNTASGFTTNTGTVSSLSDLSITSTAAEINKLDGYTGGVTELNYLDTLHATGVTSTEFNYLDGVTSNIQTQLDGKLTSSSSLNATNINSGTLASARLPDLAVSDFGGAAIQTSLETFADNDTSLMTSAAIEERITGKGYTTNTGDITRVSISAGDGLSGSLATESGEHNQTINLSHLGFEDLVDPNDDRIAYWDDSAQKFEWLDIGSNLSISGNVLNAADTNIVTNLGQIITTTAVTITSSDGDNTTLSGATTSAAGIMTASQVSTLDGLISDTGVPAILGTNGNATLNTGITGEEVRTAIGAGDMTQFTITDPNSTNEVITQNDSFGVADSTYVNLRLTGSVGSRSITASLNNNFVSYKTFNLVDASDNYINSIVADVIQDTFTFKEGTNIDLTSTGDTLTISTTAEENQFAFKTFQFSNNGSLYTTQVADAKEDTFTFNAGTGINFVSSANDYIIIELEDDRRSSSSSDSVYVGNATDEYTIYQPNGSGPGIVRHYAGGAEILRLANDGVGSTTGGDGGRILTLPNGQSSGPDMGFQTVDDAAGYELQIFRADSDGTNRTVEFSFSDGGTFHADNDIIAFSTTTTSDRKLKENIQKVDNALELVCKLDGVTFDWKDKERGSSAGVVAQNVEEVLPSAVNEVEELNGNDTVKVVDYNQLSALFIESIKELKQQNEELKAEVEKLKSINSNS